MKTSRYKIAATIVILYLLPIVLLSGYSLGLMTLQSSWSIFSIGLLLAFAGSCGLFLMLCKWEMVPITDVMDAASPQIVERILPPDPELEINAKRLQEQVAEQQIKQEQLLAEIQAKQEELQRSYQEHERFRHHMEQVVQELESRQQVMHDQFEKNEETVQEQQKKSYDSRVIIEKQQQRILELEAKEQELNYEIETLLQVTHLEALPEETNDIISPPYPPSNRPEGIPLPPYPIGSTSHDGVTKETASGLLKRCVEIANKMAGVGSNSRLRDLPLENYVLDMRRLCDNLRMETSNPVLLYSQKESKVLFANGQIKNILGWPSEKVVQIFPEIIQEGAEEWRKGIQQLSTQSEAKICVPMKAKDGQALLVHCHLGAISNGLFRNLIIVVLE